MSHFTRLKTKIVEKEYLKQALIDLYQVRLNSYNKIVARIKENQSFYL